MQRNVVHYTVLIDSLLQLPRRHETLMIAIDGCGGSGKSTCARRLQQHAAAVTLVEMDSFFRPSAERPDGAGAAKPIAGDYDWERLVTQVLDPLRANRPGRYQRYDWPQDMLAEFCTVPIGGVVIVEGVYSTLPAIADCYDVRVWVEAPPQLRLARGIARDGEAARVRWVNDWLPAEQKYVSTDHPQERSDLIVDGSGSVPHDPVHEFVCFSGLTTKVLHF